VRAFTLFRVAEWQRDTFENAFWRFLDYRQSGEIAIVFRDFATL
jgi:hypothetical protein